MKKLLFLCLILFSCSINPVVDDEIPTEKSTPYHSSIPIILIPGSTATITSATLITNGKRVPMQPEGEYLVGTLSSDEREYSFTLEFHNGTTLTQIPHTIKEYSPNAPLLLYPHPDSLPILMHWRHFIDKVVQPLYKGSDTLQLDSTGLVTTSTSSDTGRWFTDNDDKAILFWGDTLEEHLWAHRYGYYRFTYSSRKTGPRKLKRIAEYTFVPRAELSLKYNSASSITLNRSFRNWHNDETTNMLYLDTTETIDLQTARTLDVTNLSPFIVDSLTENQTYYFTLVGYNSDGTEYGRSPIAAATTKNLAPPRVHFEVEKIRDKSIELLLKPFPISDFRHYQIRWREKQSIDLSDTLWQDSLLIEKPDSMTTILHNLTPQTSYLIEMSLTDKSDLSSDTTITLITREENYDAPKLTYTFPTDSTVAFSWKQYEGEAFASYEVTCRNLTNKNDTITWTSMHIADTTVTFEGVKRFDHIYEFKLLAHREDGTSAALAPDTTQQILAKAHFTDLKRVTIRWKTAAPYTRYYIYRKTQGSSYYIRFKTLSGNSNACSDEPYAFGNHYYYVKGVAEDRIDTSNVVLFFKM